MECGVLENIFDLQHFGWRIKKRVPCTARGVL